MDKDRLMKLGLPGNAFRIVLALENGENYTRELARMTDMNPVNAHKTVCLLNEAGIIEESQRIGRNIFFRLK